MNMNSTSRLSRSVHPLLDEDLERFPMPEKKEKRPKEAAKARKVIAGRFASQARPSDGAVFPSVYAVHEYRSRARAELEAADEEPVESVSFKGILKRSGPASEPPARRRVVLKPADERPALKLFSATCKSIKAYSVQFSGPERARRVGPYLFEVIAQLDSSILVDPDAATQSFVIRDQTGHRVNCVYFEMDREMERVKRDSFIRCVGNYGLREAIFKCVSVRIATKGDIFQHGFHVNLTDREIEDKYLRV